MKIGIINKLRLISLFPIIMLIAFASYFLYISATNYLKVEALNKKIEYSEKVNILAKELAAERGLTAIFIASSGKKVAKKLNNQRKKVDYAINNYNKFLANHPHIKPKKITTFLINTLKQKREQIDTMQIDFENAFFNYYTKLIKTLILEIDNITTIGLKHEIANEAKAYVNFALAKEYTGIERGYISYILTRYTKLSEKELNRWIHFIGQTDSYEYSFIGDKELKQRVDSVLTSKESQEVLDKISKARIAILYSISDGYYTIDPLYWFNLNSKKIEILSNSQQIIYSSLKNKSATVMEEQMLIAVASAALWIIAFILAVLGYIVSKEITQNIKNLERILQSAAKSTNKDIDINLETAEGTAKAYSLLQNIIEETRKEQKRAEEASKAKSLFLANMSHEIRTPLNGIVGFTELLKNTELNSEQKEFVSIIEKSSENLLEIINNILDLSKVESNKVEIENIVFDPIEEFESAVEIYAAKAAEKGINLACFIDPRLNQPIKGDPTKIKEILINLLSNAIKFTSQGGSINVEIRRVEASNPENCAISFSVEDSGIGISPDKKAHIFEAFSQADTSVTRKFGGTGLGLTISARYTELMGGRLQLESELGKGTRFYFTLEFDKLPQIGDEAYHKFENVSIAIYAATGNPKKQDHYIKEYLLYFGAKSVPFSSPDELIALAKEKRVQSVLIDGDYATDTDLRKMGKTPLHCNVIIKSTQQKRIEALKLHCEKIIYEPVNGTKILSILKSSTSIVRKGTLKAFSGADKISFDAKALVAEDNTINQKLIKRTLEDLGLEVELADNGLEAFEKRRNGSFDIIFMDISMPVMDGVEATHEILDYEEDENLSHVPIVALTANALKGDRERFLAEGLDEYTTKPLIREEIVSILKKFLSDKIRGGEPKENEAKNIDVEAPEIEDNISFDNIQVEEPQKEFKADEIAIIKKSPLESKIFANMLQEMGYKTKIYNSMKELLNSISKSTTLVFIDKEIEKLSLSALKAKIESESLKTSIILMHDPTLPPSKEEIGNSDEVIVNLISKDLARLLIEKFINQHKDV